MSTPDLLPLQESLTGYLYLAVESLENVIRAQESTLDGLKQKLGEAHDLRLNASYERLVWRWERRIEELRAGLISLRRAVAVEERRISKLMNQCDNGGPPRNEVTSHLILEA